MNILDDRDHPLHHLLPESHSYTLRNARTFDVKFKNLQAQELSFINSQCLRINSLEWPSAFLNKTLFVVYAVYVYVDILYSYNFSKINCNFGDLVVLIF